MSQVHIFCYANDFCSSYSSYSSFFLVTLRSFTSHHSPLKRLNSYKRFVSVANLDYTIIPCNNIRLRTVITLFCEVIQI